MNGLTEKDGCGNWCLRGVPWKALHAGSVITKAVSEKLYGALWKLMEYEDTDLTPEQVQDLQDRYAVLEKNFKALSKSHNESMDGQNAVQAGYQTCLYNKEYPPPHTCDVCTSLDEKKYSMWEEA